MSKVANYIRSIELLAEADFLCIEKVSLQRVLEEYAEMLTEQTELRLRDQIMVCGQITHCRKMIESIRSEVDILRQEARSQNDA